MADETTIDLARESPFRLGALEVDPPRRRVSTGETLEPRVMQVLVALSRANGAVVSRDELVRTCWDGRIVGEDAIPRVIGRLRRLAEERGAGNFAIETVPKVGYRLVGQVAPVEDEPAARPAAAPPPAPSARWRRPALIGLAAALIALLVGGAAWWAVRDRAVPATVALTAFTAVGGNVAPGLPAEIGEATLAAFSEDSQVAITRAPAAGATGYTLGGTVARNGDRLVLSARIENAATGAALWSRAYDQPASVGDKVARWLAARTAWIARCGMGPLGVYGRPLGDATMTLLFAECDAEAEEQVDRALDQARRLTQVQPDLAAGWSAVAYYADALGRRAPPDRAAPLHREADAALARALALDPQGSRAWHVKVYRVPPTDLVGIDRAFQRALTARLSLCACVFQDYANFLRGVGRSRDARRMLERARDVVPLQIGPRAGLIQLDAADGRTGIARRQLAEVDDLGLDPVHGAQFFVSNALWLKDYGGALMWLRQGTLSGPPALSGAIEQGFRALAGSDPAARAAAARTLATTAARCRCTGSFSIRMQAALGDAPGALAAIEGQVAQGKIAPMLSTIGWDPVLADVRRLPGFTALVDRVGLMRYWRSTHAHPDFCDAADPPPVCATI